MKDLPPPSALHLPRCPQDCALVDYAYLGMTSSCIAHYLAELWNLISACQSCVPSLSVPLLTTSDNVTTVLGHCFGPLPSEDDEGFYSSSQLRIKQLRRLLDLLSSLPDIESDLAPALKLHNNLSSCQTIAVVFRNLRLLHQCIFEMQAASETTLFHSLEAYPDRTAQILRSMMKLSRRVKLPNISFRNFETIGVGRWVDDEIINYFVAKWCSRSSAVLGLSTFFASNILFQQNSCLTAKRVLGLEDEIKVQRWCRSTEKAQDLKDWESVFIPINENNSHWYSACINFRSQRIEIYDSLRHVCLVNRRKPVQSRKNTDIMLVLMWLTEVLSRLRGETVELSNNPFTAWRCDPHTEVPFQPNSYDCGIHTLWHLRHVLYFGSVRARCELHYLKFSDNMIGQRLILAQELFDDCNL
ncbi:hypothetical protein GYMLUDRAFT_253165 [Collybiopsis luxurians FD-317 M1]|uniref:Ubiquitin-like protease family profile domain-containing protein n=1 Tax=Collybiopsis luxurians FD-317 M1 TaxID=944289 RepID=A0A0D0AJ58_9AGAR|nr:hypothetical protein GYMLUDRAFT_253165 [Collybiopsis luxurians FD-317 M1]